MSLFISVIVPVKDGGARFRALMAALAAQDFSADRWELLVADNGSTDGTPDWARTRAATFPVPMTVLDASARPGSYAARNVALQQARGNVLAFTDADCLPVPGWLSAGLRALEDGPADLAGGHVRFTFRGSRPDTAELVDSLTNMQMEIDILQRGVTKTANLFARREVFDRNGPFPDDLRSGGDVQWTGAAVRAGFRLVFAPAAEVAHPARSWGEMWRKQVRVGRGQMPVMRRAGRSWGWILRDCFDPRDPRRSADRAAATTQAGGSPPRPWRFQLGQIYCRLGTITGRALWLLDRKS